MIITLNNRTEELEKDKITIQELLDIKKFSFKMLVVKHNDILIKRHAYESTVVKNGDIVTVLHLMSGG
ncbi:MAG: sulfur carrier protein ThiS [Bacteroidales bacterium]|nr:sulfur carrier protein ThiS [Bacteroidales bacterium]